MYVTLPADALQLLLMGIPFSAILYSTNNYIVGSYNRRITRKLLGGKS